MNILLLLVPLSVMLLVLAIGAFAWAVRRGQFEDLDAPAFDIVGEDPLPVGSDNGDSHAGERSDAD